MKLQIFVYLNCIKLLWAHITKIMWNMERSRKKRVLIIADLCRNIRIYLENQKSIKEKGEKDQ